MSSNFERTITANPELSFRIQDFLASVYGKPIHLPGPGPAEDAAHPAAQASTGDATPAAEAEAPAEVPECDRQQDPGSGEEVPAVQDVAAVIAEGQAQAERGETADRGSFAEHAEPASHLGPDAGHQLRSIPVPAKDETAEADLTPDAGAGQ